MNKLYSNKVYLSNGLPQGLAKVYIECFLKDFVCKALTFLLDNWTHFRGAHLHVIYYFQKYANATI